MRLMVSSDPLKDRGLRDARELVEIGTLLPALHVLISICIFAHMYAHARTLSISGD